jgi:hypothetical protein
MTLEDLSPVVGSGSRSATDFSPLQISANPGALPLDEFDPAPFTG